VYRRWGDEGKGTTTAYYAETAPDAPLIVRYNGGPQAAHNVVTDDGRHHTFQQFGSGMFRPGAETFLSKHMLVNPLNMVAEQAALERLGVENALGRMFVSENARVITPYHIALNRLRELTRGDSRHGSCGQGVGETMRLWLCEPIKTVYARDFACPATLRWKLNFWRETIKELAEAAGPHPEAAIFDDDRQIPTLVDVYGEIAKRINIVSDDFLDSQLGDRTVIFEGAQGVLLDEDYGFHPYTTWSHTTPRNAFELLDDHRRFAQVIGVTRTFMTRHGAGPFPTELVGKTRGAIDTRRTSEQNTANEWQGNFREGFLDLVLLQYAKLVCADAGAPITHLAVTHEDVHLSYGVNTVTSYDGADGPHSMLPVGAPGDLEHQEKLTLLLANACPGSGIAITGPEQLAHHLRLTLCLRSRSPHTISGKRTENDD
jgi:adenylosuccinate synthase